MTGAMEYAQARIQARHGARPDAREWSALHASITLAALLERARACALEPWVAGLDTAVGPDELELVLRERLRGRIVEVASWMPERWHRAVLWTRALLDLPALQHLAWGHAPPRWMSRDPEIAPHLDDTPDEERAGLMRIAWTETWRRMWPPASEDDRAALDELAHVVEAHLEAFHRAHPDDSAGLREALREHVEVLFRRNALSPAAAFCHLLLLALDAERVRAELVARLAAAQAPE